MSAARSIAVRAAVMIAAWWTVAEGSFRSPLLVAGLLAVATATSLVLLPPGGARLRPLALARFVPFFVGASLAGGVDVARRALLPAGEIDPCFLDRRLRLEGAAARVFFAECLSLLPGTLSVDLRADRLTVHALDRRMPVQRTLDRLEQRVADLYGESLGERRGEG